MRATPEMAYFECLNELKLIVDLMYEDGLGGMWHSVSDTAEFGGLTRGDRVVDEHSRERMEEVLEEVQDGTFAREWILENQAGRPSYTQLKEAEENHDIEQVGELPATCSRGPTKTTRRKQKHRQTTDHHPHLPRTNDATRETRRRIESHAKC